MLREENNDIERNLAPSATWHIVEDDRKTEIGDRHEVAVEPFRVRLVVVRRHLETRIRTACGDRGFRQRHRLGRGIGARAGDDLALPRGKLNRLLDYLVVLLVGKGRGFAARADGADALDSARDLLLDEGLEFAVVDRTVLRERGDQGRDSA